MPDDATRDPKTNIESEGGGSKARETARVGQAAVTLEALKQQIEELKQTTSLSSREYIQREMLSLIASVQIDQAKDIAIIKDEIQKLTNAVKRESGIRGSVTAGITVGVLLGMRWLAGKMGVPVP